MSRASAVERINSSSLGTAERHLPMEDLERGLRALPAPPTDNGSVTALIRRVGGGVRETLERTRLTRREGLPGDAWGRHTDPRPQAQLTAMETGVARLIANGQPLGLFGDQLFLDLDLSKENLPVGTLLRLGSAVLEVVPLPHNGCQKFRLRFGNDALRLVSRKDLRHRNLRGIYMQVAEDGEVTIGDPVEVLARGPAGPSPAPSG